MGKLLDAFINQKKIQTHITMQQLNLGILTSLYCTGTQKLCKDPLYSTKLFIFKAQNEYAVEYALTQLLQL